jgi:hypothetical protein
MLQNIVEKHSHMLIMFPQGMSSLPFHWLYTSLWSIPRSLKMTALLKICSQNLSKSPPRIRPCTQIGKANTSFAKFVVDFLFMLLLFDLHIDHNVQAAPA